MLPMLPPSLFDSDTITSPLPAAVVRSQVGGTATATYTLNSDGHVWRNTTSGDATTQGPSWLVPNLNSGLYEVAATLISGSISTGDTSGSYFALSTSRSWTKTTNVVGSNTAVVSLSIRHIGTTSILVTTQITLDVEIS